MKMTPREALQIQAEQVSWYQNRRHNLACVVANMTDISGLDLDLAIDVVEINKRIPRGTEIETLVHGWHQNI